MTALGLRPLFVDHIGWPDIVLRGASNTAGDNSEAARKFKSKKKDYDAIVPNLLGTFCLIMVADSLLNPSSDVRPLGDSVPQETISRLLDQSADLGNPGFHFGPILSDYAIRNAISLPLGHALHVTGRVGYM